MRPASRSGGSDGRHGHTWRSIALMGYNTTLFILNDAMGQIDQNPIGWWGEVKRHHQAAMVRPQEFGFGSYGNGFWVVANHHADVTKLIAVGGNYASVLASTATARSGHHAWNDRLDLLARSLQATLENKEVR